MKISSVGTTAIIEGFQPGEKNKGIKILTFFSHKTYATIAIIVSPFGLLRHLNILNHLNLLNLLNLLNHLNLL
ncbi:MAG TPA: hypothetical protein P5041_08200, partial [Candidatus Cloacimonas sp.]|nr:hypothetical protein [Candidatus Cloacimonas sp.]